MGVHRWAMITHGPIVDQYFSCLPILLQMSIFIFFEYNYINKLCTVHVVTEALGVRTCLLYRKLFVHVYASLETEYCLCVCISDFLILLTGDTSAV